MTAFENNNQTASILIVDDEENMRHMLSTLLSNAGYEVQTAENGQTALQMIQSSPYAFVLCDIKMPQMDGMTFLQTAGSLLSDTTVIMMSAYGTMETALEAMKQGAYDYISKPFKSDEVLLTLEKAREREKLKRENVQLKQQLFDIEKSYTFDNIVARSKAMQAVIQMIQKIAGYDTTVLVTGESGTGKELVTRSIHFNSHRSQNPFVPINCGGIPENLLESELFGYAKGAFTGAEKKHAGLCEKAHKGTLFLDEIGELPLSLQVKLLRVLQDSEIRPIGDTATKQVDIRIIAATAKNLETEVARGTFREDLFYRLNVMPITLPPLRERPEDIPFLCRAFLERFNQKFDKSLTDISPSAMNRLMRHNWPGNVRELENVMERSILLAEGDSLTDADLNPEIFNNGRHDPPETPPDRLEAALEGYSLKAAKRICEQKLITKALLKTGGNRTQAAKLLEISHPSLLSKIKAHQIKF